MPSLDTYLASKPLFYKEIDYTRMPRAWKSIEKHFKLPRIIHLVGTNGKGSTGRFLAHYLYKSGFVTGHYSSPHIVHFNERIWLNGMNVNDDELALYHDRLYNLLNEEYRESLSYFEYTTLLAIAVFEQCDYVVLEAGLGGEYDATAVFDNILTLVTPIDFDHMEFLGDTLEAITTTKLNAIQKSAIMGKQKHKEVYDVAKKVAKSKGIELFDSEQFYTLEELDEMATFLQKRGLASFLHTNLSLALAAVKFLGFSVELENLIDIELFGRCQKISDNITIDVGHNALAASALVKEFENHSVILVFNTFADKEYEKTLRILKPAIKSIEILPILNERVEKKENLVKVIEKLGIQYRDFKEIDTNKKYLVFGSFTVVEAFLEKYGKISKEATTP